MNITAKNFDLTPSIREYIEKKGTQALSALPDAPTHIDVEVDRTTNHHQKGDVFHVRFHVQIPHGELYAEETTEDLYAAIDIAAQELQRQSEDDKEKKQTRQRKARRTMRSWKSIMSFWNSDSAE